MVAVLRAREIEDDDVGVELGGRVPVDWSGAVMLEPRRNPLARGLGRVISEAGLHVPLELVERNADALPVRVADPRIAAHQRGQRNTLRGGERRVPPRPVRHRLYRLPTVVHIGANRAVAHELFARERMLPLRQLLKVLLVDLTRQAPIAGELPMPHAADLFGARVVILAGVAKLFPVIRARLAGAQRLRNGEHGGSPT
jgi:hypothetical protein